MPDALLRKLVLTALITAVLAAFVRSLRGDPAPQFGGKGPVPNGSRSMLVPAPTGLLAAAITEAEGAGAEPSVDLQLVSATAQIAVPVEPSPRWAEPVDDACPPGFPIKAKLTSGIFHVPGGLSYDRTNPDRCYPTTEAAEADGLRGAKR